MCINNVHDDITITEEESTWIGNIIILDMLIINFIAIYIYVCIHNVYELTYSSFLMLSDFFPNSNLLWVRPMVSTKSNLINAIDIDL